MPAAAAFLIDGPSADASGMETTKSVRLLVDCSVDQLRHGDHVEGLRSAVIGGDAGLLGGGDHSVFDHGPEGIVRLSMGHDNDVRSLGRNRRGGACDGGDRGGRGDGQFDYAFHAVSSFMGDIAPNARRAARIERGGRVDSPIRWCFCACFSARQTRAARDNGRSVAPRRARARFGRPKRRKKRRSDRAARGRAEPQRLRDKR